MKLDPAPQMKSEGLVVRSRFEALCKIRYRFELLVLPRQRIEDQLPHALGRGIGADTRIESLNMLLDHHGQLAGAAASPAGRTRQRQECRACAKESDRGK